MEALSANSTRSGQYVLQPTGYEAFIPSPLPPDPSIKISSELQKLVYEAGLSLGRLDGSIQTLPNPDLFVYMYVRKEAVLSSQIEGTQSSLQDLLTAESKILAPGRANDVAEVVNYVKAMKHGLEQLEKLPVSTRLIRDIHAKLLHGVRGSKLTPGELRKRQNWIGSDGTNIADAVFVPPPPTQVQEAMTKLEKFIHADSDFPLLLKIGLVHSQFETIHPFLDGNGRIGRLLITFLLCERKVLQKPVLYLSYFFKKHRSRYYDKLQAVRDDGDWEGWLVFFLQGIIEVSKKASKLARRIIDLREKHRNVITENFGRAAGNGHRLLERLYVNSVVSVTGVQQMLNISYPTARNLVKRMQENEILREVTGQRRNQVFCYQDYIDLFIRDGIMD